MNLLLSAQFRPWSMLVLSSDFMWQPAFRVTPRIKHVPIPYVGSQQSRPYTAAALHNEVCVCAGGGGGGGGGGDAFQNFLL